MRGRVGLVVPVWYPEAAPDALCETLLRTTLADWSSRLLAHHVALVVDGVPRLAALAQRVSAELSGGAFQVVAPVVNQGKGGALVVGWKALLADPALEFIAARDADGDHFLDDLPHLFRLGEQMTRETGREAVLVLERAHVAIDFREVLGELCFPRGQVLARRLPGKLHRLAAAG